MSRGLHKTLIISIAHLEDAEFKPAYKDAVRGPLFVLVFITSHKKFCRRNERELQLRDVRTNRSVSA